MLWRVIIAVLGFVFFILLYPLVMEVLRIPLERPVDMIIRICAAGIALFYIIRGVPGWPPKP